MTTTQGRLIQILVNYPAKISTFGILLFAFFTTYAQNENSFLIKLGAGMSYQKVRDEGMSPLLYSGTNYTFSGGADFSIGKSIHKADIRFDYGDIESTRSGNIASQYRVEGAYTYYRFIKDIAAGRISWFAGGNINSLWVLRDNLGYVNNSFNTDYFSSIGPASMVRYNFDLFKKGFSAEYSVNVPLVAFMIRPSYSSTTLPGFLEEEEIDNVKGFLRSGEVAFPGKFFRFNNEAAIRFHLRNQNALRLSYCWDYYSLKPEFNPVKSANHQVMFQLMFSF